MLARIVLKMAREVRAKALFADISKVVEPEVNLGIDGIFVQIENSNFNLHKIHRKCISPVH